MRKAQFTGMQMAVDNDIYEGQTIERMIEQAETQKQPIEAVSPMIYTPRKDGVRPEYDIRTDRFAIAQNAMDKVSGSYRAQRDEWIKSLEQKQNTTTTTNTAEA